MRAHRRRPGRRRRRDPRLLRHDRLAGRRHRAHGLAGGRAARPRAGRDHRPPVRLVAAGGALRRPGRDVRHPGPRRRRRRAEHERDPDLRRDARRPAVRLLDAVRRVARLAGALRRPGGQPVPLGRDDRREVGHLPRGDGGVRARLARAGPGRDRRGPVRERDRAGRRSRRRASTPTSARARRRWRRWPASSRWRPAAGSPPRSPRQICDALGGDADRLRAGGRATTA